MDYQSILQEIYDEIQPYFGQGRVADYIPALADVPPDKFGLALVTIDGATYTLGAADEPFSVQSIAKVFTLTLALQYEPDRLWTRVGKEPSGQPFNSLIQLEIENGIPRNPFINAGALVVTDCLLSHTTDARQELRAFVRRLARNEAIDYDVVVASSEKKHGYRNAALANLLKSFGNIDNPVEEVLDVYFHQCALRMSCLDLARACTYLADGGRSPLLDAPIISRRQAKRINSLLLVAGLYDAVGDFAYRVGMPGKSGVGGGIVAVIPNVLSICVWAPELNAAGNSLVGTMALELFTTRTGLSIF